MRENSLATWVIRFIFCIFVILAYNTLNNFGIILSWFEKIINILTPFIIGGVIAFLLFPICKKTEKFLLKTNKPFIIKRVRLFATLIVAFVSALFIGLILLLICPIIYESLINFLNSIPRYVESVQYFINDSLKNAGPVKEIINNAQNTMSFDNFINFFTSLDYNSYFDSITGILFGIFNLIIGAIISIYLLLERAVLKKALLRASRIAFKTRTIARIRRLSLRIAKVIYTFIFGQIIDAFMVACLIGMFLTIFQIDNSAILAVCYLICATIPYFGSMIGVLLVALLSLISGDIHQFLIATPITLIIQQLDANLISPKIVGQAVGIGPLYVILGITLFGGIFGIYGLFLGPPLMAICMELLDDFIRAKEIKTKKNLDSLADSGILSQIKNSVTKKTSEDEKNDKK